MTQTIAQSQAVNDVLAERRRQVEAEGWTPEHDDQHDGAELLRAATLYYLHAVYGPMSGGETSGYPVAMCADGRPLGWPWERHWWKPKDRRRDLVRAGALCLAEEDRVNRRAGLILHRHYAPARHKLGLIIAEIERLDRQS